MLPVRSAHRIPLHQAIGTEEKPPRRETKGREERWRRHVTPNTKNNLIGAMVVLAIYGIAVLLYFLDR